MYKHIVGVAVFVETCLQEVLEVDRVVLQKISQLEGHGVFG